MVIVYNISCVMSKIKEKESTRPCVLSNNNPVGIRRRELVQLQARAATGDLSLFFSLTSQMLHYQECLAIALPRDDAGGKLPAVLFCAVDERVRLRTNSLLCWVRTKLIALFMEDSGESE